MSTHRQKSGKSVLIGILRVEGIPFAVLFSDAKDLATDAIAYLVNQLEKLNRITLYYDADSNTFVPVRHVVVAMPCDGPAKSEFAGVCFGGIWTSMFRFVMDAHVAKDLLPNCPSCARRLLLNEAEEDCTCGQWKYAALMCSWTKLDKTGIYIEKPGCVFPSLACLLDLLCCLLCGPHF
jgi:hypothetical protein